MKDLEVESRQTAVWKGINRQLDSGLISRVLPWFDFSKKWIKKWSIMMWLVLIIGSGTNTRAFLHHGVQWPLSEKYCNLVAVIWEDLRLFWSCSDLSWPAWSGSSQFMPVLARSKLDIPLDIAKLCPVILFGAGTELLGRGESKVLRPLPSLLTDLFNSERLVSGI